MEVRDGLLKRNSGSARIYILQDTRGVSLEQDQTSLALLETRLAEVSGVSGRVEEDLYAPC